MHSPYCTVQEDVSKKMCDAVNVEALALSMVDSPPSLLDAVFQRRLIQTDISVVTAVLAFITTPGDVCKIVNAGRFAAGRNRPVLCRRGKALLSRDTL